MSLPPLVTTVPFAVCAAVYAVLALLIVAQARRSRTGLLLAAAAAATAVWAAAGAAAPMAAPALDLLRLLAWYGFCLHLYVQRARPPAHAARAAAAATTRLFQGMGLAAVCATGVTVLFGGAGVEAPVSLLSPGIMLRLMLAIATLLLLENLYRGTAQAQRWHMGLACIALGALAAYDLLAWSDAVLLRAPSPALLAGRPLAAALVTPLLAVAAARNRHWRIDIHVSHTAAFHSATLVVSGVFLMALAATGEMVRYAGASFGASWGSLAEIGLVFGGVLGVGALLTSGSARSLLRRGFVDHFFTHRYDYRREWQRCIGILSAVNSGLLPERVIRALADVVDSPSGLLFVREPGQAGLGWAGAWNTRPAGPLAALAPELADALCAADGPAVVAHTPQDEPAEPDGRAFTPWLAVPLREPGQPGMDMGCILLARPRTPFRLDAEVFDLLRVLAHEVAIHLAQQRAAAVLLQTADLRAYGERFAFVAHDIKNVSSQLSLLLANAETHLADPAFQKDMLATVRASVARIGGLIRRLEPAREPPPTLSAHLDAAAALAALLAGRTYPGTRVTLDTAPAGEDGSALVGMDRAAFEAAVTHLLDNAVTAAGPSGLVRVALRAGAGRIVVDITDDGPGLSPEFIRDVLFTPFATRTEGGSGLGAFQARELLRAAEGDLAVLSRPGSGTTMRLSLPRLPVPGAATAPAPAMAEHSHG